MAINDKDFYASHGLDFDIEKMQIEYTKRVINQAKIEVLTELQKEIEELDTPNNGSAYMDCAEIIQQKIDKLKEGA
jgi:hypothetical protein